MTSALSQISAQNLFLSAPLLAFVRKPCGSDQRMTLRKGMWNLYLTWRCPYPFWAEVESLITWPFMGIYAAVGEGRAKASIEYGSAADDRNRVSASPCGARPRPGPKHKRANRRCRAHAG